MTFAIELRQQIENQEAQSVGSSFGGDGPSRMFSVPALRNWMQCHAPFDQNDPVLESLRPLYQSLTPIAFKKLLINLIRFSFLIELTDLKVGSTKMKSRWLPGLILMPQANSFVGVKGSFEPGNDQRAASFDDCVAVFQMCCDLVRLKLRDDKSFAELMDQLGTWYRTPYEFVFAYVDPAQNPVHHVENIRIADTQDVRWLVTARQILGSVEEPERSAIAAIESRKLEVKAYKTDRSLTGKDKTNRAKRWEVISEDFQHATLAECWSVERKLISDLVNFDGFPDGIRQQFYASRLIEKGEKVVTCCPVTLAPLNYPSFARSVLLAQHGRSDYQVGHLNPLKRGGKHVGRNICWQSADGNRIQGDLTIDETVDLLHLIASRRLRH